MKDRSVIKLIVINWPKNRQEFKTKYEYDTTVLPNVCRYIRCYIRLIFCLTICLLTLFYIALKN